MAVFRCLSSACVTNSFSFTFLQALGVFEFLCWAARNGLFKWFSRRGGQFGLLLRTASIRALLSSRVAIAMVFVVKLMVPRTRPCSLRTALVLCWIGSAVSGFILMMTCPLWLWRGLVVLLSRVVRGVRCRRRLLPFVWFTSCRTLW